MSNRSRVKPFVVAIEPDAASWTVSVEDSRRDSHVVASPLSDRLFLTLLADFREWSGRPIQRRDRQARGIETYLTHLADEVRVRLTEALLADHSEPELAQSRLIVRVSDSGRPAEGVLALPWELVAQDVVRELVVPGGPELTPPPHTLKVAVHIAAPEDLSPWSYEAEALRLQAVLAPLGHRIAFSDLGGVEDLVELVEIEQPHAVHFSGHGRSGRLAFEDELGFAREVDVKEVVRSLRGILLDPGRQGSFPGLFFLSARGPAVAVPGEKTPEVEPLQATAAYLHRSGFATVIGYFGPEDAELASRAEETFYRALARGEPVLTAAAEARATLDRPLGEPGAERWYPLGHNLLPVYFRGLDRSFAKETTAGPREQPTRRHKVEVSGLPVLERGFIGRRDLQHEALRRIRTGARLLVLQGQGGLGKTALACKLVTRLADQPVDQLILRCRELEPSDDPILDLWSQAEEHGYLHALPGWLARTNDIRTSVKEPPEGLATTIREIWRNRPDLVVYVDNAETLQVGPKGPSRTLGAWRPGLETWWARMEQLVEQGPLILISTRYAWKGLSPRVHLGITPLGTADTWRLIDTFDNLAGLPWQARRDLANRLQGHPRAVEILDRLVGSRRCEVEEIPNDVWTEIVVPNLPKQDKLVRDDLLLEPLWHLVSAPAREQARNLSVLRQPAPDWVVDRLGDTRDELIRTSLLTRYREPVRGETGIWFTDRWGLHGVVQDLAATELGGVARDAAHRLAGEAWAAWLDRSNWLRSDQREAIHHLHLAGEAARAWPILDRYFQWLRVHGRYQEARSLLEESLVLGLSGEPRQIAKLQVAQLRTVQADSGSDFDNAYEDLLSEDMSPVLRARTLHEYAVYLDLVGRPAEAEPRVRRALEIQQDCPDVPAYELAISRVLLGRVLESLGRYREAEQELRATVPLLAHVPAEIRPQLSVTYHSLARVLDKLGAAGEAESLFRKAAEMDRELGEEDDPQYAVSLESLGWILLQRGKPVEAEGWLRRALAIQEKTFGREHPETATTMLTLARALAAQERYREAEELAREVLAIDLRTLAEGDPNRGHTLNTLAGILRNRGRPSEAETLLREALSLQEKTLGPQHPSLVSALTNLGGLLVEQDRPTEAVPLIEQALRLARAAQGAEGPEVARALPWLARAQSQLFSPEARETARLASILLLRTLGEEHPTTKRWAIALKRIADGTGTAPSRAQAPPSDT